MPKKYERRRHRADPREVALEIVRRAKVPSTRADGFDGIPYVIRISDPMTASERFQLAAVRLLRRPVVIIPHPCKSLEEWDRNALQMLREVSVEQKGPVGPKRGVPSD
jgi:hypothetical protein